MWPLSIPSMVPSALARRSFSPLSCVSCLYDVFFFSSPVAEFFSLYQRFAPPFWTLSPDFLPNFPFSGFRQEFSFFASLHKLSSSFILSRTPSDIFSFRCDVFSIFVMISPLCPPPSSGPLTRRSFGRLVSFIVFSLSLACRPYLVWARLLIYRTLFAS